MKHQMSESRRSQDNSSTVWISLALESDLTFFHHPLVNCHLANILLSKLLILQDLDMFRWVLALKETPDLWGGKLKHSETPMRKRILDVALSNLLTRPPRMVRLTPTFLSLNGTLFRVSRRNLAVPPSWQEDMFFKRTTQRLAQGSQNS